MANKNILLWIYAVGIIPLTIFYFSALVIGTFFLLPIGLASLIVYPLSVIGISSSSVFGDYARAVLHIFILISMPLYPLIIFYLFHVYNLIKLDRKKIFVSKIIILSIWILYLYLTFTIADVFVLWPK